MTPWHRRCVFGRHGQKVVAIGCVWEIVALIDGVPVPTISETVKRHPWFGWALLGLLGHHWFWEAVDGHVEEIFDDLTALAA